MKQLQQFCEIVTFETQERTFTRHCQISSLAIVAKRVLPATVNIKFPTGFRNKDHTYIAGAERAFYTLFEIMTTCTKTRSD
jgi:hypothetical protein